VAEEMVLIKQHSCALRGTF